MDAPKTGAMGCSAAPSAHPYKSAYRKHLDPWQAPARNQSLWQPMNSRARARRMRDYERSTDHAVPGGQYVVARLDGRGFSKLTREQGFQHPFDPAFRAAMVSTTQHLMKCGPQVLLGYTQSDEISLLFHPECRSFGRRSSKLLSVLAGEASAVLSLALGVPSVFDCRLSCLPSRLLDPKVPSVYKGILHLDISTNSVGANTRGPRATPTAGG